MKIIDLGQDTYLIGRKVIKAMVPGMFDLSKQEDRDTLSRISEKLYATSFSPRIYGDLTVCGLRPTARENSARHPGVKYDEYLMHFMDLHEEAKSVLRKEFPDHAGEF